MNRKAIFFCLLAGLVRPKVLKTTDSPLTFIDEFCNMSPKLEKGLAELTEAQFTLLKEAGVPLISPFLEDCIGLPFWVVRKTSAT